MREYSYRTISVPEHLNSIKIKEEFKNNVANSDYLSLNTPYNDVSKIVKNTLKEIYNDKCAYCESSLHNEYGDIEHYRPKKSSSLKKCNSRNSYYWLAFSWDNLIPCCKICNTFKSNCFDIFNKDKRLKYDNESLEELHHSLKTCNKQENPKLIHPEIDKFENDITFFNKGQLISNNEKVRYTLKICKLNRKKLKEVREKLISKYHNYIKKQYSLRKRLNLNLEKLSILFNMNVFDELKSNLKIEKEYSIVSYYIYNNFTAFILNDPKLKDIDKKIINQLWIKYKKDYDK